MANYPNHWRQAQHNEAFAAELAGHDPLPYLDWLITVSFYAAVHYAEALFFFQEGIVHTESACPDQMSQHAFRMRKIREILGKQCWKSYRKLQVSSYNVRYLGLAQEKPADIAVQYYSLQDAKRMYSVHLRKVRDAIQQELDQSTASGS